MSNKQATVYKTQMGGKEVIIETGKFCELSHGSCLVKCGDTLVMVNATMSDEVREGIDFFPLEVDFQEKLYSVGKIPGGFKRREGRGSDEAILTSRLIDRSIRPLFPKNFYHNVNVVATALSIDPDVKPEPLAMLGASFALSISGIPFEGPTGSVNVAIVDDEYIINPNAEQSDKSLLSLTVCGTADAIMMIEAGAKEVTEEQMLKAIMIASEEIKKLVKFQQDIKDSLNIEPREYTLNQIDSDLEKDIREFSNEKIDWILSTFDRKERNLRRKQVDKETKEHFSTKYEEKDKQIGDVLEIIFREKVRERILKDSVRPDGRKLNEIRPIWCDVSLLPRVHGSAVFTRGQTQVLTTLTLGAMGDAQQLDGFDNEESKRYMHQYNMPPYSTGESRGLRGPGRREIGHGALAERALEPMIPMEDEFPYSLRLVSEVLSSNGSSSMASVCGSTLALMDGGVPIKAPVAGIAMGLIKKDDKVLVLTDIQGLEDFLGDMDFKVAGTENGITAIQMDIKIKGIDEEILKMALKEAKIGRLNILNQMLDVIDMPRKDLSKYAPKIITFEIDPDKIREVIGSGGKVINKIISDTGVKIDIEDDGQVFLASTDSEKSEIAKQIILNIVENVEIGKIYSGTVIKTAPFGAFVEIAPGKDGMIHISKLSTQRVEKVEDIVTVGDKVEVEVIKIDERNRIGLKLIAKA
ncbi:MAG: polyribonucleotide nucleotidyltransferase [Clostridia bacterium]|nr:polyribonucleotide nucleotidyltransferase [Clostridia bacterium]MDD4686226.1 polyribonucleotide nucleotidyltransferase [Clostridia bacterium]